MRTKLNNNKILTLQLLLLYHNNLWLTREFPTSHTLHLFEIVKKYIPAGTQCDKNHEKALCIYYLLTIDRYYDIWMIFITDYSQSLDITPYLIWASYESNNKYVNICTDGCSYS